MIKYMRFRLLFVLLLAIGINSKASEVQTNDSLRHYMDEAVLYNPSVLQKLEEYKAALQKVKQAGSLNDPELSAGIFLSPMELMSGNQVADIQLMQMFPWFGVLRNAKDEMSLMAKSSYETFRETRSNVLFDLQNTWYDLLRIKLEIRISESNAEILKTIEKLMIARFRSGGSGNSNSVQATSGIMDKSNGASGQTGMNKMTEANSSGSSAETMKTSGSMQNVPMGSGLVSNGMAGIYLIQIEIGDLENDIALLRSNIETISIRFNGYLNRPSTSSLTLPEEIVFDEQLNKIGEYSESLVTDNPMLTMLNYDKQALEAREKMIKQMSYPMIGLGIDYSIISKSDMSTSPMNGKDMIMPMLKATLPVYGKKYKAMRSETMHLKKALELSYSSTVNGLRTEYYEAKRLFEDAVRRIKLYESQFGLAKKSLDIMIKSFSVSGTGLTDILQVRKQLLDYETKRINAVYDYNLAVVRIGKIQAKY